MKTQLLITLLMISASIFGQESSKTINISIEFDHTFRKMEYYQGVSSNILLESIITTQADEVIPDLVDLNTQSFGILFEIPVERKNLNIRFGGGLFTSFQTFNEIRLENVTDGITTYDLILRQSGGNPHFYEFSGSKIFTGVGSMVGNDAFGLSISFDVGYTRLKSKYVVSIIETDGPTIPQAYITYNLRGLTSDVKIGPYIKFGNFTSKLGFMYNAIFDRDYGVSIGYGYNLSLGYRF